MSNINNNIQQHTLNQFGHDTLTTTAHVTQQVPIIEHIQQAPVVHQVDIIKEVPIVQQQRVVEKMDIIENQPCKVGETHTIQVTTSTVPTPISLISGQTFTHQENLGFQNQQFQNQQLQFQQQQQFVQGGTSLIQEERVRELETRLGESEQQRLTNSSHQVQPPLAATQNFNPQVVGGDYMVTRENPIPRVAVAQSVEPLGYQMPVHQQNLVTETIVHPVYDEHGRMTLPKDIMESGGHEMSPGHKKEKVGLGTKLKNMLHRNKNKNATGTEGAYDSTYGSNSNYNSTGLNQGYGTTGLNQGYGTTGLNQGYGTTGQSHLQPGTFTDEIPMAGGDYKIKQKIKQDADGDFKTKTKERFNAK